MELKSPHTDPYSEYNQTLEKLKSEGYQHEFIIQDEGRATANNNNYKPDDLVINAIYRFEGKEDWFTSKKTSTAKRRELIAMDAKDGTKGYLAADYGEEGDDVIDGFLINVDRHDELHTNYN